MKAEDLRIGNIVQNSKGEQIIIESLSESGGLNGYSWSNTHYGNHSGGFEWELNINDVTPIPLTEEWLLKFGFSDKEYKPGFIGIDIGNTDFTLTKPNIESKDVTLKHFSFHCSYGGWPRYKEFAFVHDLQNFFWALHGEDLKIKE